MSSNTAFEPLHAPGAAFQRAQGSPDLPPNLPPKTPGFLWFFVAGSWPWFAAALVFQTLGTGCGILLPWALGKNLGNVRLFVRSRHERSLLEESFGRELVHIRRANGFNERVRWFQFAASAVLKGGTLWFALVLWGRGDIDVASFVMATSLTFLVINESRNLSRRFLEISEHIGAVQNGVKTLVRPHEQVDRPGAREAPAAPGAIEYDRVRFAYGPDAPVFQDLSLAIPAGQKVGLVGPSGSGKSTFVNLLLRLYDPQEGAIRLGGEDLRAFTQDSLRDRIGLIPQDPSLFHRTLKDNIRYGRIDAGDAEVERAARKAHAHDFIAAMRDGYDSLVGERGVKLSGGQRQRVAIARVLLKDAPILVLDEATSALDSITERAIQEAFDREMAGKTVVVVAHRLSTIARLDRILVFDGGRIVEDGTHARLLALGGAYARLWSRQSEGFLPEDGAPGPPRFLISSQEPMSA